MTLGDLINQLATKAGVAKDDKNLINVLSNAELSKIEVHSDLAGAIDNNLLSIEVAKDNHPVLSAVYKAQALNALDEKLKQIATDLNVGDDDAYKSEKSSYKRLDFLLAKLKEAKKADPKDDKKHEGLQKQVDDLVAEIARNKAAFEQEKQALQEARTTDQKNYALRSLLSGRKTILDNLDADVRNTTLMTAINKSLQEKDAVLTVDENGNLTLQKKDGSRLLGANHTPITLQSLIDTTLAQNKLNVVTPPQPPAPAGGGGGGVPPSAGSGGNNNTVQEMIRKSRLAIEQGQEA